METEFASMGMATPEAARVPRRRQQQMVARVNLGRWLDLC